MYTVQCSVQNAKVPRSLRIEACSAVAAGGLLLPPQLFLLPAEGHHPAVEEPLPLPQGVELVHHHLHPLGRPRQLEHGSVLALQLGSHAHHPAQLLEDLAALLLLPLPLVLPSEDGGSLAGGGIY